LTALHEHGHEDFFSGPGIHLSFGFQAFGDTAFPGGPAPLGGGPPLGGGAKLPAGAVFGVIGDPAPRPGPPAGPPAPPAGLPLPDGLSPLLLLLPPLLPTPRELPAALPAPAQLGQAPTHQHPPGPLSGFPEGGGEGNA